MALRSSSFSRTGLALTLALVLIAPLFPKSGAAASHKPIKQYVLVNGEPITRFDILQRRKLIILTSGMMGKRMRAMLQNEAIKAEFQRFMMQAHPQSREEAIALQKQFVAQLQKQVMSEVGGKVQDMALDELIDEKLMLQEAKRQKASASEADVNRTLTAMAQRSKAHLTLEKFLGAFKAQGVNPETMKARMRAQIAWRNVIRKLYGYKIQALVGTRGFDEKGGKSGKATLDVLRVRLATPGGASQNAIGRVLVQGEALHQRFTSCASLPQLVKAIPGASLSQLRQKTAADFAPEARPMLIKATAGQMLPPILTSGAVELYAVCRKRVPAKEAAEKGKDEQKTKAESASQLRQQEFQLYGRRHLKDLRQDALIEYH